MYTKYGKTVLAYLAKQDKPVGGTSFVRGVAEIENAEDANLVDYVVSFYTNLGRLKKIGFVNSTGYPWNKKYSITDKGRKFLN